MAHVRFVLVCVSLVVATAAFAQGLPAAKDQHGDSLPPGAVVRLGTIRWRHEGVVFFAAFLPNGKSVVSVGTDRTIRVWEFPSGIELRRIDLPADKNREFAFLGSDSLAAALSVDGKVMATFISQAVSRDRASIYIHDIATGKVLASLQPGDKNVATLVFSPNGKHLSALDVDGSLSIWDWTTGALVAKVDSAEKIFIGLTRDPAPMLAYSPDGNSMIVVDFSNSLKPVDVKRASALPTSEGGSGPVLSVRYEPDGKHLLTYSGGTTFKWEIPSGKKLGPMPTEKIGKNRFIPPTAKLSPNGKVWASLKIAKGPAGILDLDVDLVIVDLASGQEQGKRRIGSTNNLTLASVIEFSPTSKLLAANAPGTGKIELLEVPTAKLLHSLDQSGDLPDVKKTSLTRFKMITLRFAPDGKVLASTLDPKKVAFWNATTGQCIGTLAVVGGKTIKQLDFSSDGRCLILNMSDGTVGMYELATAQLRRLFGKKMPASKITTGVDLEIPDVMSLISGRPMLKSSVVFSPDGKLIAQAGLDRAVHVWDIATGKELAAFVGHSAAINSIAWSPDGKTLASASSDTTALIWKSPTLKRPNAVRKPLPGDLERWWETLALGDAAKGFDAICDFSDTSKEAVPFLKEQLKPAKAIEPKEIDELISQLDDDQYKIREKATNELLKIGERIVPALDKALAANPPLETKRRLEDLRGKTTGVVLQGERLRAFRAIEILERIGTPEARQMLETLAAGAPGAPLTTNAEAALKRF